MRDNLTYGKQDASEKEIYRTLDLVSARSLVEKLDQGLDTDVGEGGDLLSAGEKQLISFARAIIANPKILILDEATASVDTMTEQKIQASVGHVIQGRTSVVIAHRLSTIKNADLILVVRNGKIVEQGRREELLKTGTIILNCIPGSMRTRGQRHSLKDKPIGFYELPYDMKEKKFAFLIMGVGF